MLYAVVQAEFEIGTRLENGWMRDAHYSGVSYRQ